MSKIICDICGTSYPSTSEQCPICGCSRGAAAEMLGEDLLLDQVEDDGQGRGGKFSQGKKKKEIFDFDEVNGEAEDYDGYDESYEDEDLNSEDQEEGSGANVFVVILLTVLIAGLLLAAGFLFIRFFLPNISQEDAPKATQPVAQTLPTETTVPGIPCTMIALTSGREATLNQIGGKHLIHVALVPENTTDALVFVSLDESVATVTEDGRVEAVGEGETTILISCGNCTAECKVVVDLSIPPESTPVETAAVLPEATAPEATGEAAGTASAETTPVQNQPAPADSGLKDVTLKLKRTDIMLGVYYEFQLLLDCDLEQTDVQWSSEHPHIASVDEQGVVKALKGGTTSITATYGDQKVSCIVRCG